MDSLVTQARLKELLLYSRKTGRFRWRKQQGSAGRGTIAGSIHGKGYLTISIDRRSYLAHRLAWTYVHGDHPPGAIDHHNGIRNDNRILNLRLPRGPENWWNRRARSVTGYKGVYQLSSGNFAAKIGWYGDRIHIGTYATAEEAARNYDVHAWCLFGEFARPNGFVSRAEGLEGIGRLKRARNSRRKRRRRACARASATRRS
jgi:hypothetical protein